MGNKFAEVEELAILDAAVLAQGNLECHRHFVERRVAGAFAQAVDRHTGGLGSGLERGDRVCRGHAKIVVAVELNGQPRRGGADFADEVEGLEWRENAHCVGQTQAGQAIRLGGDREVAQEAQLRA